MRRAWRLPDVRSFLAARHFEGAELPLHADGTTQGPRHQRAQRQRTQDAWRVQSFARSGLWVLFDQALAPCEENQKRREKLSDRTSLDDQPLMLIDDKHN
jgi:hypothetical protein